MWSDWQLDRLAGVEWCDRTCQSFSNLAVEESNSASATPMDVDAVGKGKGKGCFVCGRPGHAAKESKFNQPKGKAQGKGTAKNAQPDKNTPAKFEGDCRKCGYKWADCRKRLAGAKDKKVRAVGGSGRNKGDR